LIIETGETILVYIPYSMLITRPIWWSAKHKLHSWSLFNGKRDY